MRAKKSIVLALLVSIFLMGASAAYADPAFNGYPAMTLISYGDSLNVVVLANYDASSFSFNEAEAGSQQVATLLGALLGSTLGQSSTVTSDGHWSPADLAFYGFYSSYDLAAWLNSNYWMYNLQLYVYLDMNRAPEVSGSQLGNNIRVDVWLGDAPYTVNSLLGLDITQLGVTGDYLYLASLELPELYWLLVGQLMQGI